LLRRKIADVLLGSARRQGTAGLLTRRPEPVRADFGLLPAHEPKIATHGALGVASRSEVWFHRRRTAGGGFRRGAVPCRRTKGANRNVGPTVHAATHDPVSRRAGRVQRARPAGVVGARPTVSTHGTIS